MSLHVGDGNLVFSPGGASRRREIRLRGFLRREVTGSRSVGAGVAEVKMAMLRMGRKGANVGFIFGRTLGCLVNTRLAVGTNEVEFDSIKVVFFKKI